AGVTFVASTGDVGGVSEYPAASPNVLAVGGTTLNLNAAGNYAGELAWAKGGGGVSPFEGQPAYQKGVVSPTLTARSTPDVAFDGPTDTLPAIYRMPGGNFHDVAGGGAPHPAALGYDVVTGRGSPVANAVVSYLVADGVVTTHFRINVLAGSKTAGAPLTVRVT